MYKLLIVDDSSVQTRMIKALIDWEKFGVNDIKVALNGLEGLDMFKKYGADIVITDMVMPLLSGTKMTEEIKAINPNVKFIYISCHDEFSFANDAVNNNVFSYLLKPVDAEMLSDAVTKVITAIEEERQYTKINKMLDENLETFRKNFLYSLLYSDNDYSEELSVIAKDLGFNKFNSFLVAYFELPEHECEYSLILELFKYTEDNLFKRQNGYLFLHNKTSWSAVFMSDSSYDLKADVKNVIINHFKDVSATFSTIMLCGMSESFNNLSDAKFMFTQAQGILENQMVGNEHNIFTTDNFKYKPIYYSTSEIYDSLSALIENTYPKGLDGFMEKFYPKDMRLTFNYIKMLCTSIVTMLHLLTAERDIHLENLFDSSSALWDKATRLDNAQDTRRWLFNILTVVIDYINDNEKNQYEKIVSKIIDEINTNYNKISNTEELVANLYISASYAKSLFKKHTGKTIFDYLLKKRIDESKKLLTNPEIKVYQVAELVGYESRTHFSDIFRRYTGVTPKEYQQAHSG